MSDEVFQGDNNNNVNTFIAEDLDLFKTSTEYKSYWQILETGALHTALEIMIRKGLSFSLGEKIMNNIRSAVGKEMTKKNFSMTDKKLKQWGISSEKIKAMHKILDLPEITSQSLCSIKEGGIHLVKAFKIMAQEDDDVFLHTEYRVLQNMGILFCKEKNMTPVEAMRLSRVWNGYKSQISMFLYSLKPEGAFKLLDNQALDQYDFWGKDRPSTVKINNSNDQSQDDQIPDLV